MKINPWQKRSRSTPTEGAKLSAAEERQIRSLARTLRLLDDETIATIRRDLVHAVTPQQFAEIADDEQRQRLIQQAWQRADDAAAEHARLCAAEAGLLIRRALPAAFAVRLYSYREDRSDALTLRILFVVDGAGNRLYDPFEGGYADWDDAVSAMLDRMGEHAEYVLEYEDDDERGNGTYWLPIPPAPAAGADAGAVLQGRWT